MTLAGNVKDGDWVALRQLVARLGSLEFGPNSTPEFSSVKLTGLTASRLVNTDSAKTLESVTDLTSWVAGTANEISVTDDSDGTITIGIVDPLIVGKGGTGAATLTDHGILLGSGTAAITALGAATNGQIPIGSTGADPVLAGITGTSNQVTATNGAGTITLSLPQDIHTGASPVFTAATIGSVAIPGIFTAQEEPTGFVDRVAVLSWDDGTRTLTITGDHDIYIHGVKTTKTTDSIQIADTTGVHWIYYNASGTLSEATSHPGFDLPLIASVYWNTTVGFDKGLVGEERHGIVMDWSTHTYLHETVGSRFESGLAGTFDDTTITIAAGEWHDEDIEHTPVQQTTCNVLYKNGSAVWEWDAGVSVYYKLNGANLRYNNGNSLADVGANQYMAMWIFATNDISTPIVSLMGQRVDTTIANARANNTYASLSFGELPFAEMKLLYRVILRNTGTPPTYTESQDFRSISNLPAGTYVATSHSTLTGLAADDHTQYALLAGRTGGQTLYGSGTTAEDLTLGDNSVDGNTITVTQAIAAYNHIHNLTTDIDHNQLTNTHNLTTDIDHDALTNFSADEHFTQANITTVGTIASGVWNGTDIAIADGGTGQSTAQAAIDALSAVAAATNEHVLTKDTASGNAIWKVAAGGVAAHAILDGSVHTDSVADGVTRGSIIYGNATPKWDELVIGAANTFLGSDGTDLSYRTAAQTMASLSGAAGADFSLNTHKLTAVTDPSSAQDAATKNYVDVGRTNQCLMRLGTTMTSVTSGSWQVVTVDTDDFDPDNVSDTVNNKITPNQAGYYLIIGVISWVSTYVEADKVHVVGLWKNGTSRFGVSNAHTSVAGNAIYTSVTAIAYFNGSTDYMDLRFVAPATATRSDILGSATENYTWMSVSRIA